jgi:hypothetical protein
MPSTVLTPPTCCQGAVARVSSRRRRHAGRGVWYHLGVRRMRYRRGFGFGHVFGLLFLLRHPLLLLVVLVVVVALYLARGRR